MKFNKHFLKTNKQTFLYLLFSAILPLLVSSSLFLYAYNFEPTIQQFTWQQWILIYGVFSITMALALTPTTFIALLSGYFLQWWGLLGIGMAYPVAAFIGYNIAQWIDKGKFLASIQHIKFVPAMLNHLKKEEFKLIALVRLSPILPFSLMNIFLSLAKVNLKNFLWASILGMLPRTILAIWVGIKTHSFLQLKNDDNLTQKIILGLLVIISIVGILKYIQKAIKNTWANQNESL